MLELAEYGFVAGADKQFMETKWFGQSGDVDSRLSGLSPDGDIC